MALIALGGALFVVGALLGPRLGPREIEGSLDEVSGPAALPEMEVAR